MPRRAHRARHDATHCPDPDNCQHTTDIAGEPCECCGRVVSVLIGTVSDAAALLGTDAAGVWELVVAGHLRADRDDDTLPWRISYADREVAR